MKRSEPSLVVVLAGIAAALHVGKLPPAMSALHDALGISLVAAGFLLSAVQVAGMLLGLLAGLVADYVGLRRTMIVGLLLLSTASALGGFASGPVSLMTLRLCEGVGLLLATMPAPALIRRLVPAERMNAMLGIWGAYMPLGAALALLLGPLVLAIGGWRVLWWGLAGVSSVTVAVLSIVVPSDPVRTGARTEDGELGGWLIRARRTVTSRGPWLVALVFAMYSGQWLAVVGFLPTVYAQAGWAGPGAAIGTAVVAVANVGGNIAAGQVLQKGVPPHRLLYVGFVAMGLGALVAFGPLWPQAWPGEALVRFAAVLGFSSIGGMIPGTLFTVAVRVAPAEDAVSTTVGWMQQWSSFGQFVGPPMVAWVCAAFGGWQLTWVVTSSMSLVGLALASRLRLVGR